MKKIVLFYWLWLYAFRIILPSFAQDAKLSVYDVRKTATDNPQFTLRTFFEKYGIRKITIQKSPSKQWISAKFAIRMQSLAIKLKKIFDAKGEMIIHSKISLDPNYVDTIFMTQVYYIAKDLPIFT